MKHLQVSIVSANPPLNVTPIDLPINDSLALGLTEAIAVADLTDAVPGDGIVEEKEAFHVRFNFAFVHLDQTINAEGVMKVVDKPDAAPAPAA